MLLPLSLETPYDYLVGDDVNLAPGDFVRVPLASRERIGVVWQGELVEGRSPVEVEKLRPLLERPDVPPLPPIALEFAEWIRVCARALDRDTPRRGRPRESLSGRRPAHGKLTALRRAAGLPVDVVAPFEA